MPVIRLLAPLLLGVLAGSATADDNWPLLRLCHEIEDLPPYINTSAANQQLPQPGPIIELLELAARQAEVRLELQRRPWKRCIHQLEQGQSDGIFVAIWQPERDAWGRFPGRDPQQNSPVDPHYRLWRVDYPIIARKGSALRWDGTRFEGVSAGLSAPLGYVANQKLKQLGVLAGTPQTSEKALRLVASGRLDGFVLEHKIAQSLIERLGLADQLTLLPRPFLVDDWHLPLSHQLYQRQPLLTQRFWQAIAEQREVHAAQWRVRYQLPSP